MSESAEIKLAICRGKIAAINTRLKETNGTLENLSLTQLRHWRIERKELIKRLKYLRRCEGKLVTSIAK